MKGRKSVSILRKNVKIERRFIYIPQLLRFLVLCWLSIHVLSLSAIANEYSIEKVLNELQARAQKIKNFHIKVCRNDIKYKYDEVNKKPELLDEIESIFEVVSQDGWFWENYHVESSRPEGFHIEHTSTTHKDHTIDTWIQQDLGSSDGFKGQDGIIRGNEYDAATKGILDAHIGLFGQYSFRDISTSLWANKNVVGAIKIYDMSNGDLKISYKPNEKDTEQIFYVDIKKGFMVYRIEHLDLKGNILVESVVKEFEENGELTFPKKVEFKQYRYVDKKRVCLLERTIDIEIITFAPALPASLFYLDFGNRRVLNQVGGITFVMPTEDIYLDPELFRDSGASFTGNPAQGQSNQSGTERQPNNIKDINVIQIYDGKEPLKKQIEDNAMETLSLQNLNNENQYTLKWKLTLSAGTIALLLLLMIFYVIWRRAGPFW